MDELTPPFFANDQGDVMIFDSLDRMASQIEAYDVGKLEFFDAWGRPVAATIVGYRARFGPLPNGTASPERLEALLRDYLSRLPERYRTYSEAAAEARSLDDLVSLCWDIANRPRPRLLRSICRERQMIPTTVAPRPPGRLQGSPDSVNSTRGDRS